MQNQPHTARPVHESASQEVSALTAPATKEQLDAVIDILAQKNHPTSLAEFE
jgi:hypothetical protein